MSVFKKTPEIERLLAKLNASQLSELKTAFNSTTQVGVRYSLVNSNLYLPALTQQQPYIIANASFEFEKGKPSYTGFLCYGASFCFFIAYHRFHDVALFEINATNKTFVRLPQENLTIDEVRRVANNLAGSSATAPFTAKEYFSPSEIRCNNNKIVVMGYGQASGSNITHSESNNAIDLLAMQTAGETINVSDVSYQVF